MPVAPVLLTLSVTAPPKWLAALVRLMYGSPTPKPPLLAVKVVVPATCTDPVEAIGPSVDSLSVPETLVVANSTALVSFSVTLPAVRPMMLKSVCGPLMVTLPAPTLMLAVPRTTTLPALPVVPSVLVTLVSELAVIVRLPVRSVSPKSMAPLTAPPVGPFCAIVRFAPATCPV